MSTCISFFGFEVPGMKNRNAIHIDVLSVKWEPFLSPT
jgi:hypothetical protein